MSKLVRILLAIALTSFEPSVSLTTRANISWRQSQLVSPSSARGDERGTLFDDRACSLVRAISPNSDNDSDNDHKNHNNEGNNDDDKTDNSITPTDSGTTASSLTRRFTSPRIDDPGLPLADCLLSQIVAPSLQVFWLAASRAPSPTWLRPLSSTLFATRGSLVAPTLIHGAGLASCWIAGALAARAYESDAFDVSNGKGYSEVVSRVVKAGAFAVGLLIFCTQLDLFWEFGGRYVQLGESEETDLRLLTAAVEVINDVVFEAVSLMGWRIYRASLTADR